MHIDLERVNTAWCRQSTKPRTRTHEQQSTRTYTGNFTLKTKKQKGSQHTRADQHEKTHRYTTFPVDCTTPHQSEARQQRHTCCVYRLTPGKTPSCDRLHHSSDACMSKKEAVSLEPPRPLSSLAAKQNTEEAVGHPFPLLKPPNKLHGVGKISTSSKG